MTTLALALMLLGGPVSKADYDSELPATDHETYSLKALTARAPFTVVEFFSASCPCQASHDPRILALADKYKGQNVQVISVDSNYGAGPDHDLQEVRKRGYPFPIIIDQKGLWADLLGAKYATYTVVLDAEGKVRYRGGFDSDRHPATDHAKPYVDDALAALLAGKTPNPAETKSLGCVLERW
jgi:AhpC/TSA family